MVCQEVKSFLLAVKWGWKMVIFFIEEEKEKKESGYFVHFHFGVPSTSLSLPFSPRNKFFSSSFSGLCRLRFLIFFFFCF